MYHKKFRFPNLKRTRYTMSLSAQIILILAEYHTSLFNVAFIVGIISVLAAKFIPELNGLLKYGKTLDVESLTNWKWLYLPKRWFLHFYLLDMTWALIGLFLIGLNRSRGSVVLLFNVFQSARRIYECAYVSKFAKHSKIHLSHYLAGIGFYSIVNLQVIVPQVLGVHFSFQTTVPWWILLLASTLFIVASIDQFFNHSHLASLKKYTAPKFGLFKYVVSAHYFDELMIYSGEYLILRNSTSFLIVVWVLVNLGTSASESRRYYTEKGFKVGSFTMIPILW